MIEVIYYRDHNRVTIAGHANSAPAGEDLVCASATILARTLAANVQNMVNTGAARHPQIVLEEGNAEISCNANHKFVNVVKHTFDSVCVGFEILANGAPDYISYTIRG